MFHESLQVPDSRPGDFLELKRYDILLAIATAQSEGFRETELALIDLVFMLDELLAEGGTIEYRIPIRASS